MQRVMKMSQGHREMYHIHFNRTNFITNFKILQTFAFNLHFDCLVITMVWHQNLFIYHGSSVARQTRNGKRVHDEGAIKIQ